MCGVKSGKAALTVTARSQGLHALQHRGQESAGICSLAPAVAADASNSNSSGGKASVMECYKNFGLVAVSCCFSLFSVHHCFARQDVFSDRTLFEKRLLGTAAIGDFCFLVLRRMLMLLALLAARQVTRVTARRGPPRTRPTSSRSSCAAARATSPSRTTATSATGAPFTPNSCRKVRTSSLQSWEKSCSKTYFACVQN